MNMNCHLLGCCRGFLCCTVIFPIIKKSNIFLKLSTWQDRKSGWITGLVVLWDDHWTRELDKM